MTWRSRPLLFLPIGFLLLLPPNGGGAQGRATSTVTTTIRPLIITCSAAAIRMGRPRADPARQRGAGKGSSPACRSPPPERQAARAARGDTPEAGELQEERATAVKTYPMRVTGPDIEIEV